MKFHTAAAVAALFLVAACSNEQPVTEPQAEAEAANPTETLHALFDEYFERGLELNPLRASAIGDYRYNDRYANSITMPHIDEPFSNQL